MSKIGNFLAWNVFRQRKSMRFSNYFHFANDICTKMHTYAGNQHNTDCLLDNQEPSGLEQQLISVLTVMQIKKGDWAKKKTKQRKCIYSVAGM